MATEYHTSTDERFENKVDEVATENEGKHGKVEDALGQATTSSKTEGEAEGYERKAEHAVVEAEDSPSLEASPEDNLKHDKVEDAQGTAETGEGDEKKSEPQPKIHDSIAENLKAEKELIPDSQTISTVTEPAPDDAANNQPEEPPPTESTETDIELEKQPKTANISEGSVETIQELSDTAEANPLTESKVEAVKETEHLETSFQKLDMPEHAVTEVQEKSEEPEKESQDKEAQDAEKPTTVTLSDPSAETNEKLFDAIENHVVQEVHEKSLEQENESQEETQEVEQPNKVAEVQKKSEEEPGKLSQEKPEEADQPNTVAVFDPSDETNEKLSDSTDKPEPVAAEVQKESEEPEKECQEKSQEAELPNKVEVSDPSAETNEKPNDVKEKPEPVVTKVHENSEETQKESQEKTQEEQPNTIAVSDSKVETSEKLCDPTEKTEPIVTDVYEKSEETEKETQEKLHKAEQPKTVAIKEPTSLNEQAQAANTANVVESSPAVAEKIIEEDGKKESSCIDDIERVSKEYSAPINIEKQVAAIDDDKKQEGAPDPAIGSSREADAEIKKIEAMKGTKEAEDVKAESAKDDKAAIDNEKQGHPETKVEVTETLASKLEEKEEEKPTKESDATKTSKDLPKETPVKPTQKQSNNIISKVKRSLLKAKKAIIGKSPTTSETISSQAKGDIRVK